MVVFFPSLGSAAPAMKLELCQVLREGILQVPWRVRPTDEACMYDPSIATAAISLPTGIRCSACRIGRFRWFVARIGQFLDFGILMWRLQKGTGKGFVAHGLFVPTNIRTSTSPTMEYIAVCAGHISNYHRASLQK